jgi:glutathione S-transferase
MARASDPSQNVRMILIGQYDSPFVRRVAVAMQLYRMDYEHRPWSVFGDAEALAQFNPLRRVPTLVCDDGTALVESGAILDWLDEQAGPDQALIAASGVARRDALRICALASGLADKAVSLVYERVIHDRATPLWVERCRAQVGGVLDVLETARDGRARWWFGERLNHADVIVGCVLRFVREAHPEVFNAARWPVLAAHADACEALPEFKAVVQPFHVTPPKG